MPLRRPGSTRSTLTSNSDNTMHITIRVTVEVTGDALRQASSSFNEVDRRAAPTIMSLSNVELPTQHHETLSLYSEAARAIAQDAIHGYDPYPPGSMFVFPEPPSGLRILDLDETTRVTESTMNEILSFGQHLRTMENFQTAGTAAPDSEFNVPVTIWMHRLRPLKNVDEPLYYFLRESLHSHTPQHILYRWDMLRRSMRDAGETIATLIRYVKQKPRKKWTPMALGLYFLLLDHNEALAESTPMFPPQPGSLELKLSALTTALRIQYYLFRMTRAKPMSRLRTYKRQLHASGIVSHMKELHGLVAQEFARLQDFTLGHLQSSEREIVGQPVRIESITEPHHSNEPAFCTICQDEHLATECVRPLNCQCIYGRDCLGPLLNRDQPFSNACPNCRTELHQPHEWGIVLSSGERDLQIGLLWALRANILSLKRDVLSDPEPFTARQRMVGCIRRLTGL